jgi:hypothetical protein
MYMDYRNSYQFTDTGMALASGIAADMAYRIS